MLSVPGLFDFQPLSFVQFFADMMLDRQKIRDTDVDKRFDLCKRSLTLTRDCRAIDLRDKIFALQGLTGNIIQPDYDKSVLEVYYELASKWISRSPQSLEVLLYSGRGFGLPEQFGLPSWVVDWQGISSAGVLAHFSLLMFAAHGGLSEHCASDSCILDGLCLKVAGCICDTITETEPPYEQASEELSQFCREYVRRKGGANYPTGIPPIQAVLRTLTFDCFLTSERVRLDDLGSLDAQQALLATLWFIISPQSGPVVSEELCSWMEELGTPSGKHVTEFLKEVLPGVAIDNRSALLKAMLELINAFYPRVAAQINTYLQNYGLFHTLGGYLGMGPGGVREGDVVCVLQNCGFPIILRKEKDSHYVHVGPCFIVGFMDGEAAQLVGKGELNIQEFEIH